MIDNLKLQILDKMRLEKNIVDNKIMDLEDVLNPFTGEIKKYPKKRKLLNLEVGITNLGASIKGSIHKYENLSFEEGNQNHNDFNYDQLSYIIPFLVEKFSIENKTSLTNLEMGFNIKLNCDSQKIIENNVLMYDLKNHNKDLPFRGKGDYKEFMKTDYSIKIYNKSKQYALNDNTIRIELKIVKKRLLQKLGIFSLEDVLVKDVLYRVFILLMNEFDKVLIIDDFDKLNIPPNDLKRLNKYTNPNFWKRIRKDKSLKALKTLEKDFIMIINKYDLSKTKTDLISKICNKFLEIINADIPQKIILKKVA